MDWLRLILPLLAVAGYINAQEGYNYPKPKTPFSGDTARDSRLPSTSAGQSTSQGTQPQGFDGAQRPFGSQQPSGGYNNGIQSQTPQSGGYPGSGEPEITGGAKRPFASSPNAGQLGTKNNQQTPFGTQQQSGGYPNLGQTGTASFRTQPQTESPFLTQQPSTGYPSSSSGTQGPFGAGPSRTSPSTVTQGSSGTGPYTGSQRPFGSGSFSGNQKSSGTGLISGTQGPSETGPSTDSQGPFGAGSFRDHKKPGTGSTSGTQGPFGAGSAGTGGSLGSQQSKYQSARPTTQDVAGGFPGERRPYEPSSGSRGQQSPSLSATARTQYPGQGRQEGYNYPTPDRAFEGNAPTTGISEDSRSSAPFFRQSLSQSPAREGAFEESGSKGTPQFPAGRESLNGYSSPAQARPGTQSSNGFSSLGPQGSISSSRPSGVEQQNGYPQSGRPQSSFPTTDTQQTPNGYSASERPLGPFSSSRPSTINQQTPHGYAQAGTPQNSFPSTSKYPGVEPQYSSEREESSFEGTPSAQSPVGQGNYRGSESTGFLGRQNGSPRIDSTEAAGKSRFPERPTEQLPINAPFDGQVTKGYPTSTQGRLPSTSQSKVGPSDYPQGEQRPLSSYLPPGVKGTGELPLSQFPSTGFSQSPSSSQLPTGVSETPRSSGNGYSGSLKPTGGLPSDRTSSGVQVPSGSLERSQNGFGSVGTPTSIDGSSSRLPSGLPGQSARSQNGYDASGTPTGSGSYESGTPTSADGSSSRVPSGFPDQSSRSQSGYDVSRTPTGRGSFESGTPASTDGSSARLPSGLQDQSPRSQNGYGVAGRRPFESGTPIGIAAEQGQVQSGVQQGAARYPTLAKSAQPFVRPGVVPAYSSDEGIQQGFLRPVSGGQAFPGFQQVPRDGQHKPVDEEGNYDEQEEGDYSAIPGQPGRDYPILSDVPETSFNCDDQEYIGYYADVETRCQIFHICANNRTYDFLCPNGTVFHQQNLVCVWWNQFDCDTAPSLYRVNKDIYELSTVGAQHTGGIPVPGQDYPDLQEGGFGFGRQPGVTPEISFRRPGGYRSEDGLPRSDGIQRSGEYPRGRTQEGTEPQRPGGYFTEESQGPSNGVGGYTNGRPQESISPSSTGYSNGKPPGSGGYQDTRQKPQEYPSRTEGQDRYQTSNGDVQRPSAQSSGGYPSSRPGSVTYPHGRPEGVEEQQPLQKSGKGKYPSDFTELQKPQGTTAYPSERPQGAGESQYPTEEQQRTGTGAPRFGGGQEGIVGSKPQSYPSDRPTETSGSQFPSPAQRPGQYDRKRPGDAPQTNNGYPSESPQDSGFSSGQGGQTPVEYGPPERTQRPGVSSLPESGKYPSGTSSKPGFRTSAPISSGSPFPGSSQPHQPTREYLPAV